MCSLLESKLSSFGFFRWEAWQSKNSDCRWQQPGNTIYDLPWSIRAFFLSPIRYSGVPSIAATYGVDKQNRMTKRNQLFASFENQNFHHIIKRTLICRTFVFVYMPEFGYYILFRVCQSEGNHCLMNKAAPNQKNRVLNYDIQYSQNWAHFTACR